MDGPTLEGQIAELTRRLEQLSIRLAQDIEEVDTNANREAAERRVDSDIAEKRDIEARLKGLIEERSKSNAEGGSSTA